MTITFLNNPVLHVPEKTGIRMEGNNPRAAIPRQGVKEYLRGVRYLNFPVQPFK